ncbi:hypothetical protein SMUL_1871 [Sulfurospirillum multivorans DSM 12446]|uniref:Uncharacterized protein n=3 Tax=Sulfurospirillum multivorans TaxID=66821 RepID=A0AA86AM08_SULMK|nr:hypothetical protein SMUL_1871 [Sulfurospirillum multivorans DSM 12446]
MTMFDEQFHDVQRVLEIKKRKARRTFLKTLGLLPLITTFANALDSLTSPPGTQKAHIHMIGDLDDDLIILKANKDSWNIEACHQMHNPVKFYLQGRCFENELCPGYIEYSKTHSLKKDEVTVICLANEREEREPDKKLLDRTHYKSVPLYVNGVEVIPSMIPELNDIDYTTWYDPTKPEGAYNYYRLWENAVVNIAVVVPEEGAYSIELINENDEVSAKASITVKSKHSAHINFSETLTGKVTDHPLAEMDGGVFLHDDFKMPNDALVRELAAHHIAIRKEGAEPIIAPLPYPFPYINRVFITAAC